MPGAAFRGLRAIGLAGVLALSWALPCPGDVMLWGVSAASRVLGVDNPSESVYTFLACGDVPWDGEANIVGARVAVKDAGGNTLRYLENIVNGTASDAYTRVVDVGHPDSPDGVGVVAESDAMNTLMRSYYFQVQVGTARWNGPEGTVGDPEMGRFMFTEILYSDNVPGSWLGDAGHYYYGEGVDLAGLAPWVPERFYTYDPAYAEWGGAVPEPSSGLLLLLGACVLGLGRSARPGKAAGKEGP